MRLPVINGIIRRRLLVNFRASNVGGSLNAPLSLGGRFACAGGMMAVMIAIGLTLRVTSS